MTDEEQKKKEAYARLEEAVREVNEIEGFKGLLIEWMVLTASHSCDADGTGITSVGYLLPEMTSTPYYRLLGLIDFAQVMLRKEIQAE